MDSYESFLSLNIKCDKFLHYFPIYNTWFSKFVGKSPRVLEIGVNAGGSAELWSKYFGNGTQVVGVDIANRAAPAPYLELVIGDQSDEDFWDKFIKRYQSNGFDIIVDDGSHENAHQILTLEKTFNPLLCDQGVYLCEDVHTSYYNGVRVKGGGLKNPNSFVEYTKNLIDLINAKHTRYAIGIGPTPDGPHVDSSLLQIYNGIKSVNFYDSVVVIEKDKLQKEFNRVNSNPNITYESIDNPSASFFEN